MSASKHTHHLHLTGQVQGVGFRPFVWRLAQSLGLQGWVNNSTDGVHVVFNASAEDAGAFTRQLLKEAPDLAIITAHTLETIENQAFADFQIIHSAETTAPNLLLTPDFGLCDDCRLELQQPTDRRYHYPFITCTNCGPRFSIVTGLPYDRERTTMQAFLQCPSCRSEYDNPADRRYYSQTNSCPACGIQLAFVDADGTVTTQPLATALTQLRAGKILAVKGIGGYLLLCDATNAAALHNLRRRKYRPDKPFALLYPHLQQLAGDARVAEDEKLLLRSPQSPIVLLPLLKKPASGLCTPLVAPRLQQIGVMLPYAPLLELLAQGFGSPLVATSGNISGAPIIFDDEQARQELLGIADGILSHNRPIAIPQDDSVLRFSPVHRQKIILRRSRGYAPTFLNQYAVPQSRDSQLALGAMMKSAFAWQLHGNIYLSQYLGELGSLDTQEAFEHTLNHFLDLFHERPSQLVVDKHPDYFSTQLGQRLAEEWNVPLREVQHHQAHFAALLAEHGYFAQETTGTPPVLGVIWDGTGYGDDGQVWGGEFFRFAGQAIERVGHFETFAFLLGDKMPREPRIAALSLAWLSGVWPVHLEKQFTPQEWELYQKMLSRGTPLRTSSVGRLFDGVAAMLDLASESSYEGQAAMLLEQAADSFFRKNGLHTLNAYPLESAEIQAASTSALVRHILLDRQAGTSREEIAARFHRTLIEIIRQQAQQQGCATLAFSGGVWQNATLVDLAITHLQADYQLLFHQQLSPNDEGIALGQLFL